MAGVERPDVPEARAGSEGAQHQGHRGPTHHRPSPIAPRKETTVERTTDTANRTGRMRQSRLRTISLSTVGSALAAAVGEPVWRGSTLSRGCCSSADPCGEESIWVGFSRSGVGAGAWAVEPGGGAHGSGNRGEEGEREGFGSEGWVRLSCRRLRACLPGLRLHKPLRAEPCQTVYIAPAPGVEPELEPLAAFKGEVEPRFGGFT
jgi:hypothetical protein